MNNLNDFNKTLKGYVNQKKNETKQIVIDCRPNAIVGKMIVNPPSNQDERDEYVAAMISCIAEIMSSETGYDVEDVAIFLANRFGEAAGELYAMAIEEEDLFNE